MFRKSWICLFLRISWRTRHGIGAWDLGHCCFCAAKSQAPGLRSVLILGSFIILVENNNEISTLLLLLFWLPSKSRGSLILIVFQHHSDKAYASQLTQISSSPSLFFKQPVQQTGGRVLLLSLSSFGWLPSWLGRNQEPQIPSLLLRSVISQTSLSPVLTFGLLQEGSPPPPTGLRQRYLNCSVSSVKLSFF